MSKEEIEARILMCEIKEREYLEVGNTKSADRYHKEIEKWENLLEQLNPKLQQENRDLRIKINNSNLELEESKLRISRALDFINKENIRVIQYNGFDMTNVLKTILDGEE